MRFYCVLCVYGANDFKVITELYLCDYNPNMVMSLFVTTCIIKYVC